MEDDILPWSEVPGLLKIYEESGTEYYGTYLILENFYRWHVSYSDNEILIFTPNGKIDNHGTHVVIFPQNFNIMFDTKNVDLNEIKTLVKKCIETYFNKQKLLILGPLENRFWPLLQEVFSYFTLLKEPNVTYCSSYYLSKEEAKLLQLTCPDEVYIGPVKEHEEVIDSNWPHRYDGSINLVRMVIERNGGIGVFLKENDELVSWALIGHYNGPGLLQTVESHKRKGYGLLSAIAVSKLVAEKDRHPYMYILNDNTPSQNLFYKLGFKRVKGVFWSDIYKA